MARRCFAEAAAILSISPGSHIGPSIPPASTVPGRRSPAVAPAPVGVPAVLGARPARTPVDGQRYNAKDALAAHVVDRLDNVLGDLIVGLDNTTVVTAAGRRHLSTAEVVGDGTGRRRRPNQDVRFARLGLGGQVLHTLGSPWVAYMLFVAGLALIVFEFYTASIGLAGLTGALALVGGFTGFSHLPVQWWAVGLLMLGILGFTIDVQAGGLGPWTAIGAVALVAGSITLYGGSSRLDPGVVVDRDRVRHDRGVHARWHDRDDPFTLRDTDGGARGTPGRDGDGGGRRRSRWRRASCATRGGAPAPTGRRRSSAGDPVRVVSIDGLVLEVEPETGGAREIHT